MVRLVGKTLVAFALTVAAGSAAMADPPHFHGITSQHIQVTTDLMAQAVARRMARSPLDVWRKWVDYLLLLEPFAQYTEGGRIRARAVRRRRCSTCSSVSWG